MATGEAAPPWFNEVTVILFLRGSPLAPRHTQRRRERIAPLSQYCAEAGGRGCPRSLERPGVFVDDLGLAIRHRFDMLALELVLRDMAAAANQCLNARRGQLVD